MHGLLDDNSLPFEYNVSLVLRDEDGFVKDERSLHNLICTAGKNTVLAATGAEYLNQYKYIAIGTGTTAAAIGDTALQTEVARNISTASNPTAAQLQFTYTFPAGTGTGSITECGLLDATSSGNLLNHLVFSAVSKGALDTLAVTITIS